MTSLPFLTTLGYIEIIFCAIALYALVARKLWSEFWALGSWLAVRIVSNTASAFILFVTPHIERHLAYRIYFYVYWSSSAIESILALIIVYSIFRLAMAPLQGLQSLGMLVFRWAAVISIAVALGSALTPHISSQKYLMEAISQLQRTQSILTLCLLTFVCFAIRPMGLDYGSRIFGVSLGLGFMSTTDLVQSAWLGSNHSMGNAYSLVNGIVACLIVLTWTAYFVIPEPKRRLIVLPTTSPFLRWNQISLALGDSPGDVAIGGVPPEIFAPAELEVMRRASLKMVTNFPRSIGA